MAFDIHVARVRSRREYGLVLAAIAGVLLAFAATGMLSGRFDTGRDLPDSAGNSRVVPTSLNDLVAASSTILIGQVVGGPTIETVTFGQSSPLGDKQAVHELKLDITTYEIRVDRCVAGSCSGVTHFKEAVDHENPPLVKGADVLFFVEPSITGWGAPGVASHYGREGLLVSQAGAVVALSPNGGAAAQFLKGESFGQVASRAAALATGTR